MTATPDAPSRGAAGGEPGTSSEGSGRAAETRLTTLAIGAVIAIGVAFCFVTTSDLWLDEALSVNVARLPLGDLNAALKMDGAPPLYYLLLHGWTGVFGTSNLAARSLSGVFGVGSLALAWFAGRRIGGRPVAWAAVVVLAANPFAIRYATEARMYGLEIFLVFLGILAFRRALERPDAGRLVAVAALVAALVYTQYWAPYLLAAAVVLLAGIAVRGTDDRRPAARRILVAVAVGAATFLPFVPTFLYQAKHTGTPWGQPVLPGAPIGKTFIDFAGSTQHEGWLNLFPLIGLMFLGLFGAARDRTRVDLDLRTQPGARWEAFVGAGTLLVGTSAAYVIGSAFQTRYSAIVLPFFVLVVARGLTCFADARVLAGVAAVIVVLGFIGGGRNVIENRTQAGEVADVLRADARPGDVILYCPDQLGPAVHRLAPAGLDEVTYPFFASPERVNWVDYRKRLKSVDPADVARKVLDRSGPDHTIWLVLAPGYDTHVGACEKVSATLEKARPRIVRVLSDAHLFEKPGLQQFPAR